MSDLISREALKKAIKEKFDNFIPEGVYDEIDNAPTISPYKALEERPQGEWIEDYTAKNKKVVACNKCHCLNIMGKSNFCPNCGADMQKGGAE